MVETSPGPDKPLSVFISYSRDDVDFADQLHATLIIGGYDATIDRHGIHVGEDWERRLGDMIRSADTIVFLLSPSSARSQACAWEVEQATRLGKRIIPVACRPLGAERPPPALAALNYIHLYAEPRKPGTGFGPGLLELRTALNTDLAWLREHTRLLQRASEWDAGGRPAIRLLSGRDIAAAKAWAARQPKEAPTPTALHLAYFRASEDEDGRRQNVEVQRLQQVAEAQAARGAALAEQEAAQAREAQALQREARQARRVVRATLAGLFAALGLAGVAAWLGYNAETERARAQRALDQVISSANARVMSLAERAREAALSQGQITNLAASVATGAASAGSADGAAAADLERIAGFLALSAQLLDQEEAAAALNAAEAGLSLANLHHELPGDLPVELQRPTAANAGAAQSPQASRWLLLRSRLHQQLGLAAAGLGRHERAARELASSLALAGGLAQSLTAASTTALTGSPAGPSAPAAALAAEAHERLAAALQDMGDIGVQAKRFDEAAQHYARLLALRSADAATPGAPDEVRWRLASAHNRQAHLYFEQTQAEASIAASRQAINLLEPQIAGGTGPAAPRRELSIAYQLTADALKAAKQPAPALQWLDKDLALVQALADSQPADAAGQHALATVHAKRGVLQDALGQPDAALVSLARAISLGEALVQQRHRRLEWQRDTAAALELRGGLLTRIDRSNEALPAFRRALALREQVAAGSPDVAWQRELEDAYRRASAVLLKGHHLAEALEAAEQQLFATSLAPDDDGGKNNRVARALGGLGWTALFARDLARARWAGEQALALNPQLAMAKLNYAHALMYSGETEAARQIYLAELKTGTEAAIKWRRNIRSDFAELSASQLQHPLMARIDREIGP